MVGMVEVEVEVLLLFIIILVHYLVDILKLWGDVNAGIYYQSRAFLVNMSVLIFHGGKGKKKIYLVEVVFCELMCWFLVHCLSLF